MTGGHHHDPQNPLITREVDAVEALTREIEGFSPPSQEFADVIELNAARRCWPLRWLNDAVTRSASHFGTSRVGDARDEGEAVSVFVAAPQLLRARQLLAGRGPRDREDIERLLHACLVTSATAAEVILNTYYLPENMNHRAFAVLAVRFRTSTSSLAGQLRERSPSLFRPVRGSRTTTRLAV